MSCEKFLHDLETRMDMEKRKNAKKEARKLATIEKEARVLQARQEYYEACLEKARKEIATCFVPEDLDGSFYKALRDKYFLHAKLLHTKEDGHIPDRAKSSISKWATNEVMILILVVALAIVLWLNGIFSFALVLLLLLLLVASSFYFAYLAFCPSVKKRLQIAAECKAVCEILESRS